MLSYGEIVHYRWEESTTKPSRIIHSACMVIGVAPRYPDLLILLPVSDTHFKISMTTPIVAKNAQGYVACDATCPFNPEYEGAPS